MTDHLELDTGPIQRTERRMGRRMAVAAPVLIIPLSTESDRFWATAENISAGGMFITTPRNLPLYSEVVAKIVPKDGLPLRATARVVRADHHGLGCCFVQLSPRASDQLNRWLGRSGGLKPISGTIEV